MVATFGVSATILEDVAEMLAAGGRVGLSSGVMASRRLAKPTCRSERTPRPDPARHRRLPPTLGSEDVGAMSAGVRGRPHRYGVTAS